MQELVVCFKRFFFFFFFFRIFVFFFFFLCAATLAPDGGGSVDTEVAVARVPTLSTAIRPSFLEDCV
jgi:hypothetical protein